jgi:4-pyridoxolactonase
MATAKKVRILDGGSLVIGRSQVLWHIDVGTPVRFPVYSVLIEHPDGLFMYGTGWITGQMLTADGGHTRH